MPPFTHHAAVYSSLLVVMDLYPELDMVMWKRMEQPDRQYTDSGYGSLQGGASAFAVGYRYRYERGDVGRDAGRAPSIKGLGPLRYSRAAFDIDRYR